MRWRIVFFFKNTTLEATALGRLVTVNNVGAWILPMGVGRRRLYCNLQVWTRVPRVRPASSAQKRRLKQNINRKAWRLITVLSIDLLISCILNGCAKHSDPWRQRLTKCKAQTKSSVIVVWRCSQSGTFMDFDSFRRCKHFGSTGYITY